MDDVISVVQCGTYRQHQVFDGTVRALKWIFLSLPGYSKDSVRIENLIAGEGDWICVKEVLGWTMDREASTVTLPDRKLQKLLTIVYILVIQLRMFRKDLERLVGKLRSMHLAVPGAVARLFHVQCALTQGGVYRAWLSPNFHCKITDWQALALQAAARPRHLANIVRRKPTHLGFCNASGLGSGEGRGGSTQLKHVAILYGGTPGHRTLS